MNRSELLPIEQRVRAVLAEYLPPDRPIIVGVSGGSDSVALLCMLHRMGWPLGAVHINYQARGEESDRDQAFVTQLCEKRGISLKTIQAPQSEAVGNFQNWARSQRYQAFRKYAEEVQASAIAVAHHREDQLETILQKVMRGAGPEQWSGMSIWQKPIIRPLLGFNKKDLRVYLDNIGQSYRWDSSNEESGYARNFLRHQWMPQLNKLFPGWQQNLLRLPDYARQFAQSLDWMLTQLTDQEECIKLKSWLDLPPDLRISVLNHWIRRKDTDLILSQRLLQELGEQLGDLQSGKYIPISDELAIWADRNRLVVDELPHGRDSDEQPSVFNQEELPATAHTLKLSLARLDPQEWLKLVCVDAAKLSWPIRIRTWRPGDRMRPLGMQGEKKISDILTDEKVPSHLRRNAQVILTFEESICAVIFPPIQNRPLSGVIAEPAKCDASTTSCLVIQKADSGNE
jgi:tRNA(Ile)-lysidine synthase